MILTRAKCKKMSSEKLMQKLAKLKKDWASLPRRDSFSGIGIGGELNAIQQTLEARGVKFDPIYMEISIEL